MMGFSLIGIGLAVSMWRRRAVPTPRWWIREHLGAMLGAGAATHVAFLSTGLGRVLQWLGLNNADLGRPALVCPGAGQHGCGDLAGSPLRAAR